MTKIEGIIYKTFEQYIVLRGFAPIGDLAKISVKADAYQREAIDEHKKEIVKFLSSGEYKYFPEIILAARAKNYSAFLTYIGSNDDISPKSAQYVRYC
ncbi:hypothetical protein EZS27_029139 [termite gut metagenome]|uniref:Uncharacterized protein n=1 Tax=termite gut metagenome TaxID=433724 RepID=A0A5J4QKP3_9ZZZZ